MASAEPPTSTEDAAPPSTVPATQRKPVSARSTTLRAPAWSYLHLELTTTARAAPPLDALTARTHLTSALARFLGLAGTAIPVDLLRLDGREAWVRVPTADARAVVAAVGGWVGREGGNGEEGNDNDDAAAQIGWRVRARSTWLRGLISATGEEAAWKEVE